MNISYESGAIITNGKYFEKNIYDVSNNGISVTFDGCGAINKYMTINDKINFNQKYMHLKMQIDGENIPVTQVKTVRMIGRTQEFCISYKDVAVTVLMFISPNDNAVFEKITCKADRPFDFKVALFMRESFNTVRNLSENTVVSEENGFVGSSNMKISCFAGAEAIELWNGTVSASHEIRFVYSFFNDNTDALISQFDLKQRETLDEIKFVHIPKEADSEMLRACYLSTYFCTLENYKEIGNFKGFMAGCNYLIPARTYFRDSYYSMLPMYNGNTAKVRNEIITLSHGVREDGSCPSAVCSDFSEFWGKHFDSPSLYCIMIYDYVNNTGDSSVLQEKIKGETVLDIFEKALAFISSQTDDTGLVYKPGKFNRLDWADEVNRFGYVTYDNLLYARALYAASRLIPNQSAKFEVRYQTVKKAIDDILWDENRGYYINYHNEEFTETNLSIDTIFAVIFKIADEEKCSRILDNFTALLESRNHPEHDDFGVMCVFPPYSALLAGINKSSFSFDYHNGADWPYLSALYAYALKMYDRDYSYPLTKWFTYNVSRGNFTPVEYYSPYCPDGSVLQSWSGVAAFVLNDVNCDFFKNKI